jgi:hypothetical protein
VALAKVAGLSYGQKICFNNEKEDFSMAKIHTVTEDEYLEMTEDDMGYCQNCEDFTNDSVEPDAEGYVCDCCGKSTVMGTENALIMGLIEIVEG